MNSTEYKTWEDFPEGEKETNIIFLLGMTARNHWPESKRFYGKGDHATICTEREYSKNKGVAKLTITGRKNFLPYRFPVMDSRLTGKPIQIIDLTMKNLEKLDWIHFQILLTDINCTV